MENDLKKNRGVYSLLLISNIFSIEKHSIAALIS